MATGLDGLLFALTTTLIVARILAFPTQIDLPDNEYMVEDLVEMSPDSKRILIIDVYVVVFWVGKYL
jgi:hypothetical protein